MTDKKKLTEKQKKRYNRILRLAEELMYENGFHKLSLSDLTENLRVSRSTIYECFGSKEGLVEKVVEQYKQKVNNGLEEIIKNSTLSSYDKFLAISQQLACNTAARNIYRFHQDLKIHTPELYDEYLKSREMRIETIYKPLIEEGIKNGLFDKELSTNFLLQTYLRSTRLVCETDLLEESNISKTEAMDTITRIFLNGSKKLK